MIGNEYSLSDIAAVTGNNGNNDGFGNGNGAWWIIILLLALGRGFGFGGNNGGGYSQPIVIDTARSGGCGCSPCATQADLAAGFANNSILRGINDIDLALCQGFNGVNTTVLQGFNGVGNAICNLGYNIQGGINGLSREFADCCCKTQRAIDGVRYDMATQACDTRHAIYNSTRDIIDNANANSRAILDFLTKDKIDTLQSENLALKFQASQSAQNAFITANQEAQTAELIRRLGADCPVPAYVVNAPTPVSFATNCCGQVQYANNGGCGNY